MGVIHSSAFNFADVVNRFLDEYNNDVFTEVSEAINEVSKEAVKKLKSESSSKFGSGDYSSGWTRKFDKGRLTAYATVYGQSPTYKLAHLLEHGHVTRNGTGRTFDPTPAYVHIEPVASWAEDEAVDRAISKLEKRT